MFSAVVTAFLIVSLPLLQADTAQATLDALTIISAQLATQTSESGPLTGPYQAANSPPTSSVLSINALWILSLFVSLTTSVLAMLVKQWLRRYSTGLPTTANRRALERQSRYDGLRKWQVATIAEALPVLIHAAVALFSVGLVLFLSAVSSTLCAFLTTVVFIGGIGYLFLATAPIIWCQCPYKSPVTSVLSYLLATDVLRCAFVWVRDLPTCLSTIWKILRYGNQGLEWTVASFPEADDEQAERYNLEQQEAALMWLSMSFADPHLQKVILSARFSWQTAMLPSEGQLGIRVGSPFSGELAPLFRPPGAYDLVRMSWSELSAFLRDRAVAYCTLTGDTIIRMQYVLESDWAWSYPIEQVPDDQRLSYYALLCYSGGIATKEEDSAYKQRLRSAKDLLISSFVDPSATLSLFGITLLLQHLSQCPGWGSEEYELLKSDLKGPVLQFMASSVYLPVEFLCICRLLWDDASGRESMDEPRLAQKCRSSYKIELSPMDDFFSPVISGDHHSGFCMAAMKLAANELNFGLSDSFNPEIGLACILKWFQKQGYLYPERQQLLEDPSVVIQRIPCEIELLVQALRANKAAIAPLAYVAPHELIAAAQLIGVESALWSESIEGYVATSYGRGDMDDWRIHMLSLCEGGQKLQDARALVCATYLLAAQSDRYSPGEYWPTRMPLACWLSWLSTPGTIDLVLQSGHRRELLVRILTPMVASSVSAKNFRLLRDSRVIRLLRAWHTTAKGRDDLSKDALFADIFGKYDTLLHDPPPEVEVAGPPPPDTGSPNGVGRAAWLAAPMRLFNPLPSFARLFRLASPDPPIAAQPTRSSVELGELEAGSGRAPEQDGKEEDRVEEV